MNNKQDIWAETFPVRFGAIDKSDRLTLDAIFNYFQEAAISHAESLGVGRDAMAQTGQGWVLSRLTVIINRRPKYQETITVRSWPQGGEKLFALRNFDIRDKDNIPAVAAKSGWIIVDIDKRRPIRPQSVMDNLPQNEGIDSIPAEENAITGLPERDNLTKTTEKKVLYTDIDFNGHVNNVSYIKWIEDLLEPKLLENADKMRMDINYLSETFLGESIELFFAKIDNPKNDDTNCTDFFAFEGRKKETGKAAFRAELRIRN